MSWSSSRHSRSTRQHYTVHFRRFQFFAFWQVGFCKYGWFVVVTFWDLNFAVTRGCINMRSTLLKQLEGISLVISVGHQSDDHVQANHLHAGGAGTSTNMNANEVGWPPFSVFSSPFAGSCRKGRYQLDGESKGGKFAFGRG